MAKYTEAQLNNKNKGQVVTIALQAMQESEALSGKPLDANSVKGVLLNFKKEAIAVAERRELAKNTHVEELAKIKSDGEKSIKELELKYSSTEGVEAKELTAMYSDIEAKAKKAAGDLTFGLEQAEIEANSKIDSINSKVEATQNSFDDMKDKLMTKADELSKSQESKILVMKTNQDRLVEKTNYENSIALRDLDTKFYNSIGKKLGLEVIPSEELYLLKSYKESKEFDNSKAVEEAVNEAKAKVHASEGAKMSALKGSTETEIALLKNDKMHLTAESVSQATRIKDLEERLKDVPNQIKEAVAASSKSVTVNQDAAKK